MNIACSAIGCNALITNGEELIGNGSGHFVKCPTCGTTNRLQNIGVAGGPLELIQPQQAPNDRAIHTRRRGKCHTYEIEYNSTSYRISLAGKTLKRTGPSISVGEIEARESMRIHAISAIENLEGMSEE